MPRNVLVAPKGMSLASADISQADIRILAFMAESFPVDHRRHLQALQADVAAFPARKWLPEWRKILNRHRNHGYRGAAEKNVPTFSPSMKKVLAEAFRAGGDIYKQVALLTNTTRDVAKVLVLSTVNGKGAAGIAKDLRCSLSEAKQHIAKFYAKFSDVAAYKHLMYYQFAMTGAAESFKGRRRINTAHNWMVTRSVVEIFVSYRRADKLWLRVIPLSASLRTLTCIVIDAIDVNRKSKNCGNRIYHHRRGRRSTLPYRFFGDDDLLYKLPVRNLSWRLIRHVRTGTEISRYHGFDKMARELFNHIAQGGTADLVKLMMLRVQPVCREFAVILLLNFHDELVFEVPEMPRAKWRVFHSRLRRALTLEPVPEWNVPVKLVLTFARRFGQM